MLKYIYPVTVFMLELVMIGSFAYFGFAKGNTVLMKYILAVILPLVAIALWGYFAAPRSSHRLPMPYLAVFRITIFLVASYFLYKCGKTELAALIALVSIATQITGYILGD